MSRSVSLAGLLGVAVLLRVPAQTGAAEVGQAPTPAPQLSPEALLRQAGQAIDADHLAEAHTLLDRLRGLDAGKRGLWAAYAILSLREKDKATAASDFAKELALHPDAIQVYPPLASLLVELKRRPEALEVLKRWAAAAPNDPRPVGLLVTVLLDDGQLREAIQAGNEGLARLPPEARGDPQLGYSLGIAELKIGQKAEGSGRLVQLLSTVDDNSVRNSIAYALAEAGVELPTAEATERAVLARLELQSEGWSLNAGPEPLQFGTPLLVASWDTMGWILFREGKPADAEPYVRASWRNQPRGTVGEHLSEIEAARGQHAAALANLQLALDAARAGDASGGVDQASVTEIEARLATLTGGAAAGAHAGKPTPAEDPAAALLRVRSFGLGTAGGRNGSATFRILAQRGKIIGSAPVATGTAPLVGANTLLPRADLSALFPVPGTFVQLVHLAVVQCAPQGCELVLQP